MTSDHFALALFWETGSEAHVTAKVAELARRKGLDLDPETLKARINKSGKGVAVRTTKRSFALRSDDDIYPLLQLQTIAPELREDAGEIEAAARKKLPNELITVADIQGMVHCHTTYSDGKHSVMEMARTAEALGMKYLDTITDHSPTAFYAGGLKAGSPQATMG